MSRQVNTTTPEPRQPAFRADRLNAELQATTSEAFARRIGRTLRTVQRWRGGDSTPGGADLIVIARALEREPEWFFESVEEAA